MAIRRLLSVLVLAAWAAPLFAQEPMPTPMDPPPAAEGGEAPAEPVPPPGPFGLPAETVAEIMAFEARRPTALPRLVTREAYVTPIERTCRGYASRMGLDEERTAAFMGVVSQYAGRRYDEVEAAHQRLPEIQAIVAELAGKLAPAPEEGQDAPDTSVLEALLIDTIRFRIEEHQAPVPGDTRINAFKALMVRTLRDRETVLAACIEFRAALEKGNPWQASNRIGAITRDSDEAVKAVLTPDQYTQYLELRGLMRVRDFEAVGSKHFLEGLKKLDLSEDVLSKASAIAGAGIAADIRFERIVRLVGAERSAEVSKALADARAALEAEAKAVSK